MMCYYIDNNESVQVVLYYQMVETLKLLSNNLRILNYDNTLEEEWWC
jgi:hypothetical protein